MLDFSELMDQYSAWVPLIIFMCRVVDVSMGTVRTIFVVRGARIVAPILGFFEVTVWIIAVSTVVKRLDHPINIVAYAGGFAAGNWVGMWLESKLAIGDQIIRFISRTRGHSIAHALRMDGVSVTTIRARDEDGPVVICFTEVPRREADRMLNTARQVDPDVYVTIEDTRSTNVNPYKRLRQPKTGWRAVLKKK